MLTTLLALAGLAVGVPVGIYGRWAGWGFGLGWWGRPTPARVLEVTPLTGAVMRGHAEQSLREQSHRVLAKLRVEPAGAEAYDASAVTWQRSGDLLAGRTLVVRVSRTRTSRVHVPRDAPEPPEPPGRY